MMVEFTANLNGDDDGDGSAVVEGTDSEINARSMWFCRCGIYFSIVIPVLTTDFHRQLQ